MANNSDIESRFVTIGLDLLEPNEGQLEGLPANPRKISESKMDLLKANLQQYPEMLSMRGLLVYPLDNGHYIIIGGNMRHRAMMELGYDSAPCIVVPKETPIERLKAYSVIDNNGFGKWDWEKLLKDWDADELPQWGLNLPQYEDSDLDGLFDVEEKENTDRLTVVIPESIADMKKAIKEDVEKLLTNYKGIKIL